MLAKTAEQDKEPKIVFPKDTTEWREWFLNRDHVDYKLGALTTQPHCQLAQTQRMINDDYSKGVHRRF